jgi:ketosteroid isomerase-like protein
MADEQRNLDLVRRLAERWNAGDLDGVLALYDDEIEAIPAPEWPDPPVKGKEAFTRLSQDFREVWERIQVDVSRLEPIGDTVVVTGAWDSRGQMSGLDGVIPFGIVLTLRDGLVVRQQWFMDPDEARRAAGL